VAQGVKASFTNRLSFIGCLGFTEIDLIQNHRLAYGTDAVFPAVLSDVAGIPGSHRVLQAVPGQSRWACLAVGFLGFLAVEVMVTGSSQEPGREPTTGSRQFRGCDRGCSDVNLGLLIEVVKD
jgi:hypothetical protein